jgi:ABC-type lipoprotein release transport system permease subunit
MAWRNVWRNRRRSLVTLGAMTLALWVMILYTALMEGYIVGMERNILDLEMGDVQVHAEKYRSDPSLYERVEDPNKLVEELDKVGYRASARLLGGGLAAAGENSAAVMFRGVNVAQDAEVSFVHKHVMEGSWLDSADPSGVVVGKRLAKNLGIGVGDEFVVLSQAADGSMANELYKVRGILKTIGDVVDRAGVFMTEAAFRELFVMPEGAHQIIVRRPPDVDLDTATTGVKDLAPDLDVKSWRELMPTIASMLDASRGSSYILYLIVYIAIGIVILNAMLMSVFERIREFGVLKAVGVGPLGVLRLILLESGVLTGLAILIGGTLSILPMWYLINTGIDFSEFGNLTIQGIAWDPIWKAVLTDETYAGPIATFVAVIALAVMYPAIKAAVIRPVSAMRHQ